MYQKQNDRHLQHQWVQLGNDIGEGYGLASGTILEGYGLRSGKSLAMSSDGNRIAVGATRDSRNTRAISQVLVYDLVRGGWTQVGSDIDRETIPDGATGWSVVMSSDGSRIAIGAPYHPPYGQVRVYDLVSGGWIQVGSGIDGDAKGEKYGHAIAMSSDGNRIAIVDPFVSSQFRVYDLVRGAWIQVGSSIAGGANTSRLFVAMSSDGNRIAIGDPFNDDNGVDSGHVRVYDLVSGEWIQIGSNINGEAEGDHSGWSVTISSDGNRIASGAHLNYANGGGCSGHVRVYEWIGASWIQIGSEIEGKAEGDY